MSIDLSKLDTDSITDRPEDCDETVVVFVVRHPLGLSHDLEAPSAAAVAGFTSAIEATGGEVQVVYRVTDVESAGVTPDEPAPVEG